jgi:hypothetical protein
VKGCPKVSDHPAGLEKHYAIAPKRWVSGVLGEKNRLARLLTQLPALRAQ